MAAGIFPPTAAVAPRSDGGGRQSTAREKRAATASNADVEGIRERMDFAGDFLLPSGVGEPVRSDSPRLGEMGVSMIFRFAFLISALLLAACASKVPPLVEAEPAPYRLGPGDELRIDVYRLDELSNTYRVSDAGVISLPLLDAISVNGLTVEEVEREIENSIRLKALVREPSVSAQISQYRPYYVVGEVIRPGQYPYMPNLNVLTALSAAGGPTFRANTKKVIITRMIDGELVSGKADLHSLVLPGDTIRVQEGWF
jgi:polysaccharide export outer membrane protein